MDTVLAASRKLHVIQARLTCLLCCYGNCFARTIQIVEYKSVENSLHVIQARLICLPCCYGNRFASTIQIVEYSKRRKQFTRSHVTKNA